MDSWCIVTYLFVGGIGLLAFLKIVGNELAVYLRVLELRGEALHAEKRYQKEQERANEVVVVPVEPNVSCSDGVRAV